MGVQPLVHIFGQTENLKQVSLPTGSHSLLLNLCPLIVFDKCRCKLSSTPEEGWGTGTSLTQQGYLSEVRKVPAHQDSSSCWPRFMKLLSWRHAFKKQLSTNLGEQRAVTGAEETSIGYSAHWGSGHLRLTVLYVMRSSILESSTLPLFMYSVTKLNYY